MNEKTTGKSTYPKFYDHKPTEDELMFFMIQNNSDRYNRYCTVFEAFEMEMHYKEEEEE